MSKQSRDRKPGPPALSDTAVLQFGILCCALAMVVVFAVALIAR